MKASDFLASNLGKSLFQWEASAVALPLDAWVPWTLVPVPVTSKDGRHTGVFHVSQDYLALGESGDLLRLPLTPINAQRIANSLGMLLPTSKMVDAIWVQSQVKLLPQPLVPNKGANLAQYAEHSRAIDGQLETQASLLSGAFPVSGQKKDIILSNIWKPGKVVIYGWYRPDGSHIQPKSNVHGDFYVDYSHGVRLVSPQMLVDGSPMNVEDVLRSPELASLLSDEGVLNRTRYPTGNGNDVIAMSSPNGKLSYYRLGTNVLLNLNALERKAS